MPPSKHQMNVARFLDKGTLVWTLTTSGYKYLTLNLYRHLEKAGCPWKLAIVCADRDSYVFFQGQGISCLLYPVSSIAHPSLLLFGSKSFEQINLIKLEVLNAFANTPEIQRCIYMDGDIVVARDFVPDILGRLEQTPLLFQCDEQTTCSNPCTNCCTGLIAWSQGADQGIFKMDNKALWLIKPEDQVWVNRKLATIPYAALPRNLYPNGTFTSAPPEAMFLIHYNHLVGTTKILKMKRNDHWIIPYL